MGGFLEVGSISHAGKVLLIGIVAGVAFAVIDSYLIMPAERQLGLAA